MFVLGLCFCKIGQTLEASIFLTNPSLPPKSKHTNHFNPNHHRRSSTSNMEAKQGHQQKEQKQEEIPRTEAAASQDKRPEGGNESVEALADLLQRTALELRERGVSCSILGKNGRVVMFQTGGEMEDNKEGEEGTASQLSMGSLVGLEECDVILKINAGSTFKYLPASSGMCWWYEMHKSIETILIELHSYKQRSCRCIPPTSRQCSASCSRSRAAASLSSPRHASRCWHTPSPTSSQARFPPSATVA